MNTFSHSEPAAPLAHAPSPVHLDLVAGVAECLLQHRSVPLLSGDRADSLLDAIGEMCMLIDEERAEVASRLTMLLNQTGGMYSVSPAIPSHWLRAHTT